MWALSAPLCRHFSVRWILSRWSNILYQGYTGNKICLWLDVGPAEDFDNLPGAAKKSLYAGAGLYLRFLCGHCIVLCPSSDIFYLALERIEFEYKWGKFTGNKFNFFRNINIISCLNQGQAPNTSVQTWVGSRLSWTKASMRAGIWLWMMKLQVASKLGIICPRPAQSWTEIKMIHFFLVLHFGLSLKFSYWPELV